MNRYANFTHKKRGLNLIRYRSDMAISLLEGQNIFATCRYPRRVILVCPEKLLWRSR